MDKQARSEQHADRAGLPPGRTSPGSPGRQYDHRAYRQACARLHRSWGWLIVSCAITYSLFILLLGRHPGYALHAGSSAALLQHIEPLQTLGLLALSMALSAATFLGLLKAQRGYLRARSGHQRFLREMRVIARQLGDRQGEREAELQLQLLGRSVTQELRPLAPGMPISSISASKRGRTDLGRRRKA